MLDRRQSARDKVIYGGVAEIDERSGSRDCVVRNISENGAHLEFSSDVRLPKQQILLTIARKGRSFLANCPAPTLPSGCAEAKRKSASCSAASRSCWKAERCYARVQLKGLVHLTLSCP
jgi:hypothetical protein